MAWKQLKTPNLNVKANADWCLSFEQDVYNVPHLYASAWEAWEAAKHRHASRMLPNVSVPVWFSHFGSYGDPPQYANWGHVVAYVPGKGFFSSPVSGKGSKWLKTIAEVEKTYNAKFVGWSEDISGVRVVEEVREEKMNVDWQRQVSRLAYGLYLNRGLSVGEFKARDKYKDPDDIMKAVAASKEAFDTWKDMATKLGVTITDTQVKAHQENYLNAWPAKVLVPQAKPSSLKPVRLKPGVYEVN